MSYFENDDYELDYKHHPKEVIEQFLEPCPFCGGYLHFEHYDAGQQYRDCVKEVFLRCKKCYFKCNFGSYHIRTDYFSTSDEVDKVKVYLTTAEKWNEIRKEKDSLYETRKEMLTRIRQFWEEDEDK